MGQIALVDRHTLRDARQVLQEFAQSPLKFVKHAINTTPTDQQGEALIALATPGAQISITSGHGTGKSSLESWAVLWFLSTKTDCKIPCTAPTGHQLFDVLWSELHKWHRQLIEPFRSNIILTADRAHVVGAEKTEFAVARTARRDNPEALQGFHAKHLLFVIDEASGIEDIIFEVAEGALSTPGARILMASNPTRGAGYFHRSHHAERAAWSRFRWSSKDSPLVSPDYPVKMATRYGIDSGIYKVRVLGEFASADQDQFIPLELLESAVARDVDRGGPVIWGLDPARMGDDETALCKRQGNEIYEMTSVRNYDTMQVAGWLIDQINEAPAWRKPEKVAIDVIGLGAGVYDRLREQRYPVIGVNVAESPSSKVKYVRLRDELWGNFRDWLNDRIGKIPNDDELIAQSSSVKYDFDSSGRIKVEGKKEMKKRGLPSPDRADAACLTFAHRPMPAGVRKKHAKKPNWKKYA